MHVQFSHHQTQVTMQTAQSVYHSSILGYADILGFILKVYPALANTVYKGALPLIAAAAKGQLDTTKLLLDYGAAVDAYDKTEETALIAASAQGHTEVVELLLAYGASVDLQGISNQKSALNASAAGGKLGPVRVLLSHGAQVDLEDINGWSPLYIAAKAKNVEVLKYLLDHGANPNTKDIIGEYPLISASMMGHTKVVKTLIEGGADIDVLDGETGCSALKVAIISGHVEVVSILQEYGAHSFSVMNAKIFHSVIDNFLAECTDKFLPMKKDKEEMPEEKKMKELTDMQKQIVKSMEDMTPHRGRAKEFKDCGDGKSLKLSIILREFMSLYLAADWQNIGALLELPPTQLQAIRQDNPNAIHCMREMLEVWLNREQPPPSWDRLIEAVEILDETKAKQLRSKFCTPHDSILQ